MATAERRTEACLALAWGCVSAVGLYAATRIYEVTFGNEPDPAKVVWSVHSGYFWRALTVLYAGGVVAALMAVVARRRVQRAAGSLPAAIGVALGLLFVQALFFP